jgi:protein-disulfide isomerase/uncharacterized membrane protein
MRTTRGALACVLLSLAGLGLCIYLGVLHIGLIRGELLGGAACGGPGSLFNCHAVTASPVGRFAGLPLWVWGLIGYLASLNLASIAWLFPDAAARALTLLTGLALGFVAVDAALLAVMVVQIRHLCLFCLLTYLVNLLLAVIGRWALGQPWRQIVGGLGAAARAFLPSRARPVAWLFWGMTTLGAVGAVALHVAVLYAVMGIPGAAHRQMVEFASREPRVAVDTAGDPSVGPAGARLELVEFSDFFCPVCQRAWKFNAIILAGHRRDVRFTFKQFPLDTSCNQAIGRMLHPGACLVAAASECAHQQGRFWEFHDLLFEEGHEYNTANLEGDASHLGLDVGRFKACLDSGEGLAAVRRDIEEGHRLGVASTPTYVINGLKMTGLVSPPMLDELVRVLNEVEPRGTGGGGP